MWCWWLFGVTRRREAAKGQRGVLGFGVLRGGFAPSPPAPLPRWGGEGWISVASFRFSVFGPQFGVFNFASSRLRVSHCGGECCGAVGVSLEGGFAPSPPLWARGARARPSGEHEYEHEHEHEHEVEVEGESFFWG